jgi:hypothetical protein
MRVSVMAGQSDVRRIALSLPGTREAEDRFAFSVHNKGKEKGFEYAKKKPQIVIEIGRASCRERVFLRV